MASVVVVCKVTQRGTVSKLLIQITIIMQVDLNKVIMIVLFAQKKISLNERFNFNPIETHTVTPGADFVRDTCPETEILLGPVL